MNRKSKIAIVIAFVIALLSIGAVAANASVVQEQSATRLVQPLRVTDYEYLSLGRLRVYFNNGAVFRAGPCPDEDSANCWWDAQQPGDTTPGRSFIDLNGTAYYLDGNYPYSV